MRNNNTYEQNFKIYSYFVDANLHISMPNIMQFMQEVAWAHSNANNIGWHFLQSKNMFWALVKLYIRIERIPQWNESILIKTWGRPSEIIVYPREFEIYDASGNPIFAATSSWVILDKEHFKPQKIKLEREAGMVKNVCVFDFKIPKIKKIENHRECVYKPVLHSDIDMNKHVNNTCYLRWVLDEYGHAFHELHQLNNCNIHFISQAQYGQHYAIRREEIAPLTFISSIFTQDQGQELCRIELQWRESNNTLL